MCKIMNIINYKIIKKYEYIKLERLKTAAYYGQTCQLSIVRRVVLSVCRFCSHLRTNPK